MDVKENDYILGIWFLGWGTGDWMASVSRKKDADFTIEYRFRYYKSKEAFDGKDEKNWYSGTTPETDESKIIEKMNAASEAMKAARSEIDLTSDCVIVRGGSKELMEAIKGKDWIHIKKEAIQ